MRTCLYNTLLCCVLTSSLPLHAQLPSSDRLNARIVPLGARWPAWSGTATETEASESVVRGPRTYDATITTSPSTTFQTIEGFGCSMVEPYVSHIYGAPRFSDPPLSWTVAEQDVVLNKLFNASTGIGLVRNKMNPSSLIDQDISMANRIAAIDGGIITSSQNIFPDAGMTEAMGNAVGAQADAMMVRLRYWKAKGRELAMYIPINEPDEGSRFPRSATFYRDLLKNLRAQMDAEGITTKLGAPESTSSISGIAYVDSIIADPVALASVTELSTHVYAWDDASLTTFKNDAAKYGKNLAMGEWIPPGDASWAIWMDRLLGSYNFNAVDYFYGFWGAGSGAGLIDLQHTGNVYHGYTLPDRYYIMGHWSRYVRPGYIRIGMKNTHAGMYTTVFKHPTTGKRVIVIFNTNGGRVNTRIDSGAATYRMIKTDIGGTDKMANKGLYAGWAPLPANSITTLIEQ